MAEKDETSSIPTVPVDGIDLERGVKGHAETLKQFNEKRNDELTKQYRNALLDRRGLSESGLNQLQLQDSIKEKEINLQAEPYWAKLKKTIEDLDRGGMEAYVEWRQGYNKLVLANKDMAIALIKSQFTEQLFISALHSPIGSKIRSRFYDAYDSLNKTYGKFEKSNANKLAPDLVYNVSMDANNVLKTSVTLGNESLDDKARHMYDIGLCYWAKKHGYEFQENGTFVNKESGALWSQADFTNCKDNVVNDIEPLDEFMKGNYHSVNISLRPSP